MNSNEAQLVFLACEYLPLTFCTSGLQGLVVGKPINLIQAEHKLLFHVFNLLVKISFA